MQTKKRAKPVKFGKKKEIDEIKEPKVLSSDVTKEEAEADINSDEAKEIKQLIEEKTHPKGEDEFDEEHKEQNDIEGEDILEDESKEEILEEEKESLEDEPEEIKLNKEPDDQDDETNEDKEEKMALETTEPVTEVETEEFHEKEKDEEPEKEDEKSSPFGSFTSEEVNRKRKKGYFGFFLLVTTITFFVGLLVIGGLSYFFSTDSESSMKLPSFESTTPTATPTPEQIVTPTPEEVDLTSYSIRVLNGSGTTGEAAKVRDELEDKGFSVSNVGNAATSDYTKTVISAKEDVDEAYLNELIKALQEQYSVNSVVEDAPSSQTADVVVTVGSDEAE